MRTSPECQRQGPDPSRRTAWGMSSAVVKRVARTVASAVLVGRAGLVAAMLVRLGHDLVWHVCYGTVCA